MQKWKCQQWMWIRVVSFITNTKIEDIPSYGNGHFIFLSWVTYSKEDSTFQQSFQSDSYLQWLRIEVNKFFDSLNDSLTYEHPISR